MANYDNIEDTVRAALETYVDGCCLSDPVAIYECDDEEGYYFYPFAGCSAPVSMDGDERVVYVIDSGDLDPMSDALEGVDISRDDPTYWATLKEYTIDHYMDAITEELGNAVYKNDEMLEQRELVREHPIDPWPTEAEQREIGRDITELTDHLMGDDM